MFLYAKKGRKNIVEIKEIFTVTEHLNHCSILLKIVAAYIFGASIVKHSKQFQSDLFGEKLVWNVLYVFGTVRPGNVDISRSVQ